MKTAAAIGAMFIAATFGIRAQHQGHDAAKQSQAKGGHHAMTDGPFVHMMSMHHQDGIKMAQLASTKASNAQVKQFASKVLEGQQKELKELETLMTKVKDDGSAKQHEGMMKKMPMDHLEQTSGAAFDRMFLEMMRDHHQEAIKMARDAKLSVPDVQQFARRTSQNQQKEVKEIEQLRKQVG